MSAPLKITWQFEEVEIKDTNMYTLLWHVPVIPINRYASLFSAAESAVTRAYGSFEGGKAR